MSGLVVAVVLFAALLHAGWNALVKAGREPFLTSVLVAGGAAAISLLALPFLAAPAPESWPYVAASTGIHFFYFGLMAAAYRHGDMSHAYPLMRGSAPLMVAVLSVPLLGERLAVLQYVGVGCISVGIFAMWLAGPRRAATDAPGLREMAARSAHPASAAPPDSNGHGVSGVSGGSGGSGGHGGSGDSGRRATVYALLSALAIAAYTLVDGVGVRKSGSPAAYTMWLFVPSASGLLAWTLLRRPRELRGYVRSYWRVAALGGVGTLASYGLALWAMTAAPVAAVAALRETAILFAAAIAAIFLREKIGLRRGAAIALIALGAALMRAA